MENYVGFAGASSEPVRIEMTGHYIVVESIGTAVLKPFEVPEPGAGQVLLENEYTVISAGTERANLMSLPNTSGRFPFYPGYCGVARIVTVGEGVTNVRAGDRVLSTYSVTAPTRCTRPRI
jgi:NADPH:quinone reductase-like Zn-dependent oxidoreductase